MKRLLLLVLFCSAPAVAKTVTLLHFSDYHSHARPFFSEGKEEQGGMAKAIRYLRQQRRHPATFVFSGGDMINKGAPAWSDKYGCVEWPWLNGLVDAMAYGNHDGDYGSAAFQACRQSTRYPILGANVEAEGHRVFDVNGKPYLIVARDGVRLGVFALAGSDFETLVKPPNRPAANVTFSDPLAAARAVVATLREKERVDLVVMIGHEQREEDEKLARAVPGIDIIFGSHSHIKDQLHRIDGTSCWYVSPFQYLTYISRLEVTLRQHKVVAVRGGLVPVDASMTGDATLSAKIEAMQKQLEHDPQYAPLFEVIGRAARPILMNDPLNSQTELGRFIMEIVRDAARADVAVSTTSSFRQPLPPGPITVEQLRATLPYPNKILVYELTAPELSTLLALGRSRQGSDSYLQIGGEPAAAALQGSSKIFRLATTDYIAHVSPVYREFFAGRIESDSGLEVRDQVQKYITGHSPIAPR